MVNYTGGRDDDDDDDHDHDDELMMMMMMMMTSRPTLDIKSESKEEEEEEEEEDLSYRGLRNQSVPRGVMSLVPSLLEIPVRTPWRYEQTCPIVARDTSPYTVAL